MTIKNGDIPVAAGMVSSDKFTFTPKGGLTKREQFAIAALQGMLSHSTRYKPRAGASKNWHEAISEEAVEIADALLCALDKEKQQ